MSILSVMSLLATIIQLRNVSGLMCIESIGISW